MTVTASASEARSRPIQIWLLIWAFALAAVLVVFLLQDRLPWAVNYPASAVVPIADWVSALMRWIKSNLSWLTRSITAVLGVPLDFALNLLAKNFKIGHGTDAYVLPRLSWVGVCAAAFLAGHAVGGRKLSLLVGGCFLYIALFGQWTSAMLTLALISIAVPFCIVTGLFAGIWAWRKPWAERLIVSPALDLMQTIPTFAYLIPMLLLFGNSPVSAMIATAIFATPPMVRATMLGLSRVPPEIDDFSEMAGCTARQKLWRVLLPSARSTLMIGVNQVIMLALNMVIIASMIGAGGLGYDVLLALRALKVGEAMEAGLAIVALAIALDRLSQAIAHKQAKGHVHREMRARFWWRYPNLTLAIAILVVTTLLGLFVPAFAAVPKAITFTTASLWKAAVNWVTVNFFDTIEAFRVALILNVLNPLRAFCEGFPWLGAVFLLGLAGYQLSGLRLAVLVATLTAFCAVTGLWEKTMATVYLCGISAFMACLIGIPIGLMASRSDRFEKIVTPVIDTLQVLPSFCFIIPVVMLFRVGDVTAMIATVAFAVVPAIRYTNHGIRQVSPALIEAAKVSGCTPRQTFFRVQLPLALPEIMLGVNQTILMALAMIIICAMVGTRDLGQEVFIALSKADSGRGIVAGLAIAFIGIVADRLFSAWTAKARARLG
ncbi:ABC transporter permease [Mesorhizobium sp. Root695]|uniref:ABC transporter permease n=1 Tax=Mesorhizobium sp. Root695 TaxID=1736589 RepID=UPI00070B8D2B|nr:ABC transporter permease subunit [Mesorhizobium sp. Root695]KRB28167.1 ABC transporter permease [Mesorhizobium sp. Root695]